MSKPSCNPFFETDFSKFLDMSKMMDMTKMMDMSKMGDMSKMMDMTKMMDISNMMGNVKPASIDMESLMSTHRRNMEAIATANRTAFEGMQNFARRQAEITRQSFEAATTMVQIMMSAQTPEEKMAKQAEATKMTMDRCLSSLKELTDMLTQMNFKTMEAMGTRVSEGMDEMQDMVNKSKKS